MENMMVDYYGPEYTYKIKVIDKERNAWDCEPYGEEKAKHIYAEMCSKVDSMEINKVLLFRYKHNMDTGEIEEAYFKYYDNKGEDEGYASI